MLDCLLIYTTIFRVTHPCSLSMSQYSPLPLGLLTFLCRALQGLHCRHTGKEMRAASHPLSPESLYKAGSHPLALFNHILPISGVPKTELNKYVRPAQPHGVGVGGQGGAGSLPQATHPQKFQLHQDLTGK